MKVVLIGDIHANLPALEAVLAHAYEKENENEPDVEAIWNVGDFVGYGAFPDQVVQRLRKEDNVLSIAGNYDLKVLQFKQKKNKWRKKKHPYKYLAFKWTYENLSKKNRKYLRFLSQEIRLKVKGRRILLTHGSPASNEEPLTPDTPEKRLRKLAQKAKADVIICGHSHQPFAREVDGVWFINTGSVGRPDDGDPRACYAILEITSEQIQVRHYRVEYDVKRAVAAIREHKLPEVFAQMTLQGRSLDEVLQTEEA
jgi:putative phosphoesterase